MALSLSALLWSAAPSTTSSSAPSAAMTVTPTAATEATGATGSSVPAGMSVDPTGERANELLADLKETYLHLDGVTVAMGATPNGEQAVAYYTDGDIVISPAHEASIDDILAHEIWHIIDWRDNDRLDWGEDLPPGNSSDYLR